MPCSSPGTEVSMRLEGGPCAFGYRLKPLRHKRCQGAKVDEGGISHDLNRAHPTLAVQCPIACLMGLAHSWGQVLTAEESVSSSLAKARALEQWDSEASQPVQVGLGDN